MCVPTYVGTSSPCSSAKMIDFSLFGSGDIEVMTACLEHVCVLSSYSGVTMATSGFVVILK